MLPRTQDTLAADSNTEYDYDSVYGSGASHISALRSPYASSIVSLTQWNGYNLTSNTNNEIQVREWKKVDVSIPIDWLNAPN